MQDNYDRIFQDKKCVMFVFAHPDDTELYAGGTLARLVKNGVRVVSVKMTTGGKGSRDQKISEQDLIVVREQEDGNSMQILGVKPEDSVLLNIPDGEVRNDDNVLELLAQQVRKFKPDLVITHNPEDTIVRYDAETSYVNHRDHRNTAISTVDAIYPFSRDTNFFPNHFADGLESHSTIEFLMVDYFDHPDMISIDVTETFDQKVQALQAHKSQFDMDRAKTTCEFFAPLSPNGHRYERFRYVIID